MKNDLLKKIEETILRHNMTAGHDDSILAAVSGGPDSVCMLHALAELSGRQDFGFRLAAVHVDHMLRGTESDRDREFTAGFCEKLGVKLFIERRCASLEAEQKKLCLEEAAREMRYEIFNKIAADCGFNRIATAHNRNDSAETVLMNIIRGTGIEGLRGIRHVNGIIIRPLLDVDREEILAYCHENSLIYRTDSTNLQSIYSRNKIRLELIPMINREFNSDVTGSLCRLAEIAEADCDFLEKQAESDLKRATIRCGEFPADAEDAELETAPEPASCIELDLGVLSKLHPSILPRVLRAGIEYVKGNLKEITKYHTGMVEDLVTRGRTGACIQLPGNIRVNRTYGKITINRSRSRSGGESRTRAAGTDLCRQLSIPGITHIPEAGIMIEAAILEIDSLRDSFRDSAGNSPRDSISYGTGNSADDRKSAEEFFDCGIKTGGIYIRYRKQGDIFNPIGSGGSCTLKKYMIKRKIPAGIRDHMPVIADGNRIIWLIGDRISEDHKVKPDSGKAVRLTISESSGKRIFPGKEDI